MIEPVPGEDREPKAMKWEGNDLRKLFEVWMDDELKMLITVFYHNNPGVIETIEGLAQRLGTSVEVLRESLADHVALGLLREKKVGSKTVLVYDRAKRSDMEKFIAEAIRERMEEGA